MRCAPIDRALKQIDNMRSVIRNGIDRGGCCLAVSKPRDADNWTWRLQCARYQSPALTISLTGHEMKPVEALVTNKLRRHTVALVNPTYQTMAILRAGQGGCHGRRNLILRTSYVDYVRYDGPTGARAFRQTCLHFRHTPVGKIRK